MQERARAAAPCRLRCRRGSQVTFPYVLFLARGADGTFSAEIAPDVASAPTQIGTVQVPMTTPIAGTATTSRDPTQLANAAYDNPPD